MAASAELLVTGGAQGAQVWDLRGGSGGPASSLPPSSSTAAAAPAPASSQGVPRLQQQQQPLWRLHEGSRVEVGSVDADGCRIVTADASTGRGQRENPVQVWDPRTGELLTTMPAAL
jgi:hypothetical protein